MLRISLLALLATGCVRGVEGETTTRERHEAPRDAEVGCEPVEGTFVTVARSLYFVPEGAPDIEEALDREYQLGANDEAEQPEYDPSRARMRMRRDPRSRDLRTWEDAPILLWPEVVGHPRAGMRGWSALIPGEGDVPTIAAWSSASSFHFTDEPADAPDSLVTFDPSELVARPFWSSPERFWLVGRVGARALVLTSDGGYRLRTVDLQGRVRAESPVIDAGPEDPRDWGRVELSRAHGVWLDASRLVVNADTLVVATIAEEAIALEPVPLSGHYFVRSSRGELSFVDYDDMCRRLEGPPSGWASAPAGPCPELEDGAWYRRGPLPIDGVPREARAAVPACRLHASIDLPPLRGGGPPSVTVTDDDRGMDDRLDLEVVTAGGPLALGVSERFRWGESIAYRIALPPRAVRARTIGSAYHVHIALPGPFPAWPNDCHEGDVRARLGEQVWSREVLYGSCE